MCRVLAYAGSAVVLDDLIFAPDSSLVRQAYDPQQLHMLNLGGFGMMAWNHALHRPSEPYVFPLSKAATVLVYRHNVGL